MNSLYPWMIFAKFVWNWPCGLKNPQLFFTIISPWKRAWPYIWTVTRECFMLSVVEIGPKFFFYCRQRIFSNLLDLPFEKRRWTSICSKQKPHYATLVIVKVFCRLCIMLLDCGGGAVGQTIDSASGRLGIRFPAATFLRR